MARVKINIDDEELHAILAKREGLELEIAQGIMQTWADHYLKALMNSEPVKAIQRAKEQAIRAMAAATEAEIQMQIGEVRMNYNVLTVKLHAQVTEYLQNEVRKQMALLIGQALRVFAEENLPQIRTDIESKIDALVDDRINKRTEFYIEQKVNERLARLVGALKEENAHER